MTDKKTQGKKNRQAGARFELKVRKDLEEKNWIVSKWMNNIEFEYECKKHGKNCKSYVTGIVEDANAGRRETLNNITFMRLLMKVGKLIPAKSNKFNMRTTGFPDFIAFRPLLDKFSKYNSEIALVAIGRQNLINDMENEVKEIYEVIGVECKSNGSLDKVEKEKCKWYLENNIFSKILIASKGKKRGEIKYVEFEE